jgi:hypothetical protein
LRYTWQINGKRIAEKQIPAEFNLLGVFAHWIKGGTPKLSL